MARSPNVRIPGEPPSLGEAEPEAREAPASAVQDDDRPTPRRVDMKAAAGDLPDADSIDVTTLRKSVLTKQGWICPWPENDASAIPAVARR
jgi:hypothetical protein